MALNYSFSGKKVLITGGGRGIGRQLVQRFHDDGAIVFTIDKNPESIAQLKEALPKVTAEIVDLSDWDATKKVVEGFGVIDHLVNNAGVILPCPFLKVTEDNIKTHYNVNVFGMINVTQIVAKGLIAAGQSGTIVNLSSMTARTGTPMASIYGSTKAAIENLTKTMAIELGQNNIRVNAIIPGLVDTPIHAGGSSTGVNPNPAVNAGIAAVLNRNINKRMIETNEIADLAMFLLSPLSTMIIGESVVIDGGYLVS